MTSSVDKTAIFVRNLPYDATDEQLEKAFAAIGPVRKSFVVRDTMGASSRGFGFVQFAVAMDAARAVERKNGSRLGGRNLLVELATQRAPLKVRAAALKRRREEGGLESETAKRTRVAPSVRSALTVAVGGLPAGQAGKRLLRAATTVLAVPPTAAPEFPLAADHDLCLSLAADGCQPGVGLVKFPSAASASAAVAALHNSECEGHILWARQTGGEGALTRRWRLIVRNVAFTATEDSLRTVFSCAGFVWEMHLPRDDDGRSRGFAFVAYISRAAALEAIARLNGVKHRGRVMAVDWALSKKHFAEVDVQEDVSNHDSVVAQEEGVKAHNETDLIPSVLPPVVRTGAMARAPSAKAENAVGMAASYAPKPATTHQPITLFAHNVAPGVTAAEIKLSLSAHTTVASCRLVLGAGGVPKGTAFLDFLTEADAMAALAVSDSSGGVQIGGRRMHLVAAVSKDAARALGAAKGGAAVFEPLVAPKDLRNLYLAHEGEVLDGSPASVGVSEADMSKRRRGALEKADKLRNPNISVSRTRLNVRNLPPGIDARGLEGACAKVLAGRTAQLRARLLTSSIDGEQRSRGIAFVEFVDPEAALACLRGLNNNPKVFGPARRPIVEFALEDARKRRQHALNVELRKRAER